MKKQDTIAFPDINFWRTDAPTIQLINSGEFKINDRLTLLGLADSTLKGSFGCTDRNEICKRQELLRFLIDNEPVRQLILKMQESPFYVTNNGHEFLRYFKGPSVPFWSVVHEFLEAIRRSSGAVPEQLVLFAEFLSDMERDFKAIEQEMSAEVVKRLATAITAGGSMEVVLEYEDARGTWNIHNVWQRGLFGYKVFSDKAPPQILKKWDYPEIAKIWRPFARVIDGIRLGWNYGRFRRWARPLEIHSTPNFIVQEVRNYVREFFGTRAQSAGVDWRALRNDLTRKIELTVGFSFSRKGLEIRLLGITPHERDKGFKEFRPVPMSEPRRYSHRMSNRAHAFNEKANGHALQLYGMSLGLANIVKELRQVDARFLHGGVLVHAEDNVGQSEWDVIRGVVGLDPELRHVFHQAERLRRYVRRMIIGRLQPIAHIAQSFAERSATWGLPLHFPEILNDNQHLVTFSHLIPIHLIGRPAGSEGVPIKPDNLVPIRSLAPLNGKMIGLTGQSRGGKTATEEEVAFLIHDAQSGFPLLGAKGVRLNVKNTLGLVFIERGQGSTLELMLKKQAAAVKGAQQHPRNGTVIILDELGTGTQESGGLKIGRNVLRLLAESGCSVIFSTQIQELAEYARHDLGAECFAFNLDHEVTRGIDSGHPERLARSLGVAQTLGLDEG